MEATLNRTSATMRTARTRSLLRWSHVARMLPFVVAVVAVVAVVPPLTPTLEELLFGVGVDRIID